MDPPACFQVSRSSPLNDFCLLASQDTHLKRLITRGAIQMDGSAGKKLQKKAACRRNPQLAAVYCHLV
jgi:hypothetical protein